jgi:hypothetical protein
MKVRSAATEIVASESIAPPKLIPERNLEIARIVERLQKIIAIHCKSAQRMGYPLAMEDLLAVVSALEAEADGLSPQSHLAHQNEIIVYLRGSLFEELLGEPSNIFYTTQVAPDVVRYEALTKDFWKECLGQLRSSLLALKQP